MNQFVKALRGCLNEKDVENNWRKEISKDCKTAIISPYTTDGYFKLNDHAVLCEFKYSRSLKKREEMIRILIQLLFYLKKFADHPDEQTFPSLLFFGDENECSLIPTDLVVSYLRGPYDWNLAPSEAGVKEQNLFNDLFNNQNISPPIWDITDDFTIRKNLSPYFIRILSQKKAEITITPNNLVAVYNYWLDNVIKDKNVSNEDNVDIFMKLLINPNDVILHPKKSDILVCIGSGKEVKVNTHGFQTFFSMYKEQHTIEQLAELAAAKDRLLLEKHRRRTGAFFTPKIWVDEAHKMMDRNLGADWREKYVVWDASAGTANLTRDYRFKELYLSTLEQTDVDIIKQSGFNPEATVFQFDFLNDGLEKLPKGLKDALKENKPIVFLNNPPYGTSSDRRGMNGTAKKEKLEKTAVQMEMQRLKFGSAGRDLVGQFIFRITRLIENMNLTNSNIVLFSNPVVFTGNPYNLLRKRQMYRILSFVDGFMFPSKDFEGVSGNYGIVCLLFKNVISKGDCHNNYTIPIYEYKDGNITLILNKRLYNNDYDTGLMDSYKINKIKEKEYPLMTNAITIKEWTTRFFGPSNSLGYYFFLTSHIRENSQGLRLFSGTYHDGSYITPSNYEFTVASFSARCITQETWHNAFDVYFYPNVSHTEYNQWVNDSIIVSIFSGASYQSSLRQVTYHNSLWDLQNHFFYLSNSQMRSLANQHNNRQLYQDTFKYPDDRFVYHQLVQRAGTFSPDAQAVLDKAIDLTIKSFPLRAQADPKFHLNAWDAGWYQIRMGILKEHFKTEYDEFRELLMALRRRMAPLVYELGFLKE